MRDWIPSDKLLLVLLAAALALRLHVATSKPYLPDESENSIPLAERISFVGPYVNIPIRGLHHPAMPSYVVKASSAVFGKSPFGYRAFHIILGLLSIIVVYRLAREWAGVAGARWAAALIAFNEYHVGVSAYATAKGPHLVCMVSAFYAFSRFLKTERQGYLYAAAIFTGLGFYSKEHSALALPVFFAALYLTRHHGWLRRPAPYLAAALFVVVISPDIIWNLWLSPGFRAGYEDHLSRIGGIGFTIDHFLFFARDAVQALSTWLTGQTLADYAAENPSMNSILGAFLLGTVAYFSFRRGQDPTAKFLLLLFWGILGFFVLARPGSPLKAIDPVTWYWVDMTLFPAAVIAGWLLAEHARPRQLILQSIAGVAMAYAIYWTTVGGFVFGNP